MIELDKIRLRSVFFSSGKTLASFPVPGLLVEELEYRGYRMPRTNPMHIPEDVGGQITLTLEGRGTLRAAGKIYDCVPGTAFLYRDSDRSVSYEVSGAKKSFWRFLWINFPGVTASRLIEEINREYGYFFQLKNDELREYLQNYFRYTGATLFISPAEGAKIFFDLIFLLCNSLAPAPAERRCISTMVEHEIAKAFQEPTSTTELAKKLGVSREHMSKKFHRETGRTLRDYRAEQKLNAAVNLLLKSNCSCKEIAQHCNYGSYSSFFRAFVAAYGISPDAFRQNNESS